MTQLADAPPSAPSARAGAFARARTALRHDASEKWAVAPRVAEILFVLPLVAAAVGALVALRPGLYLLLTTEDGLFEWLQFAAFTLAALILALLAWRRWGAHSPAEALALAVLAVAVAFVAGEEISWGQRILGFGTPETIGAVNQQDEFTLHNVWFVRFGLKLVAIAVGLAGTLLPWIARARGWGASPLVPPLFVTSAFFVLVAYNAVRAAAFPRNFVRGGEGPPEGFLRYSEFPELGLAYVVLTVAFLAWRRGRSHGAPSAGTPASR